MPPKRQLATDVPASRKPKRARITVQPAETSQVTTLDTFRVPLADADVFYVPSFTTPDVASAWYEELKDIKGCESRERHHSIRATH